MKKKLVVTIALVLLLAIMSTMFVGCDEIFKKDETRDAKQVVATVNYEGQTAKVYKFELAASFNSYSYYYVNYYGMSYEEAANYLVKSLAQQKLLVLYAKKKLAEMEGLASIPADTAELLSNSEKDRAVQKANESFISSLKTIVKNNITEDNYNKGTQPAPTKPEEVEITDPVYVRFESNGGSEVEKQKVQKGQPAKEPAEPTKSGYTFYGWFENSDLTGEEYDFNKAVEGRKTLYAKWVEYTAPRTERPEVEEDEDEDYDPDDNTVEIRKPFYEMFEMDKNGTITVSEELYDDMKDEDFVENIQLAENEDLDTVLREYVVDGVAELISNTKKAVYREDFVDGYDYYLVNQQETLLIERLERKIGETTSITDAEVEAEFATAVEKNKETFGGSETSYQSALTSALSTTYFHPQDQLGYGFVSNILLKLDDESLKILTEMNKNNPSNDKATTVKRNLLLSEIKVRVSNPNYKSTAVVEDANGEEIELRDPMTDPRNPYNKVGKTDENPYDASKEVVGGNNYNQIVSFEMNGDGKWEIKFNATQHEAMPYLIESVPAFDNGDNFGIIHQIQISFLQVRTAVRDGELTKAQGVYWLREIAMTWCYLVGDDTGAVNSDSNNGGLGYLITPEGEESTYLDAFTKYARELISAGTGSSVVGESYIDLYKGAQADGTLAGDGKVFVVADSFIGKTNTSNEYAGVFVLLNTLTVWDDSFYDGELSADGGVLPMDYIIEVAEKEEDCKTIEDVLREKLEEAKKSDAYNLDVNTMGTANENCISYDDKVIKSLWKEYED